MSKLNKTMKHNYKQSNIYWMTKFKKFKKNNEKKIRINLD
jgi:hypothetical protein